MFRENDMVRADGPPMKIASIDRDGTAECVLIDSHGVPRLRFQHVSSLKPMWLTLQPRSLWPETSNNDLADILKEEQRAKAARRAERKIARKARRSNKIKRGRTPEAA